MKIEDEADEERDEPEVEVEEVEEPERALRRTSQRRRATNEG